MEDFIARYLSVCANASDSNVTSELWLVEERAGGIVLATFLLLFLVVGLPWNLLVIATIVKQRLYTQPTIILLLNLVITDLILLMIYAPWATAVGLHGEIFFGPSDAVRCALCEVGVVTHVFALNAIYTLSLMAFDRFLFIYRPLRYEQYITSVRVVMVLVLSWTLTILVGIMPVFGYGEVAFYPTFLSCLLVFRLNNSYYSLILVSVTLLALLPLLVFNMCVCCIVQKNIRSIYGDRKLGKTPTEALSVQNETCKAQKRTRQKKELNLIRVFGGLFCINCGTWVPVLTVAFLFILEVSVPAPVVNVAVILFISQVVLHPLVETGLLQEVRKPLLKVLCCCYRPRPASQGRKDVTHPGKDSPPGSSIRDCWRVCDTALTLHFARMAPCTNSNSSRDLQAKK
jgi:hypothetical protein